MTEADRIELRRQKRERKIRTKQHTQEKLNFTLANIQPLTQNQKATFKEYAANKHLMLSGVAGTGKSFLSLYLALNQILNENSNYKKIIIIRSVVPTRDIGFLPGNSREKTKVYEAPYYAIFTELFNRGDAYEYLKAKGVVEFMTTSFIRGVTFNDSIVIVDEMQNATLHELDSCITRLGKNCRIVFSGDYRQSDFTRYADRDGLLEFMKIIKKLSGKGFSFVEFTINDIVRSEIVREYLIAKDQLQIPSHPISYMQTLHT